MANFLAGVGPGIEAGVRTAGAIQNIWDKQEEGEYNRVVRPLQLAGLQRADTMGKMTVEKAQYEDAQSKQPIDYKAMPGWETLDPVVRTNAETQIKNMGGDKRAFKAYLEQNKDNTEIMTHFATAKLAGFKNNFDEANARLTDLQEKLKLNPGDKAIELQIRALEPQVASLAERVRGSEKTAEHVLGLREAEEKYKAAPEEWKKYLSPFLKDPKGFNNIFEQLMKNKGEVDKYAQLYGPGGFKEKPTPLLPSSQHTAVGKALMDRYKQMSNEFQQKYPNKNFPIVEAFKRATIMGSDPFMDFEPNQQTAFLQVRNLADQLLQSRKQTTPDGAVAQALQIWNQAHPDGKVTEQEIKQTPKTGEQQYDLTLNQEQKAQYDNILQKYPETETKRHSYEKKGNDIILHTTQGPKFILKGTPSPVSSGNAAFDEGQKLVMSGHRLIKEKDGTLSWFTKDGKKYKTVTPGPTQTQQTKAIQKPSISAAGVGATDEAEINAHSKEVLKKKKAAEFSPAQEVAEIKQLENYYIKTLKMHPLLARQTAEKQVRLKFKQGRDKYGL